MGQECRDFGFTHGRRVPFCVEIDIALDPVDVSVFGAPAVVAAADCGVKAWSAARPDCKHNRRDSSVSAVPEGWVWWPVPAQRFSARTRKAQPDGISNPRFNRYGKKGCYYTAKPLSDLKPERVETA